jgi:hypothetical protein
LRRPNAFYGISRFNKVEAGKREIERHNTNNGNRKEFGANRLTRASIAPGFGVGDAAEVNDNAQGVGNRI